MGELIDALLELAQLSRRELAISRVDLTKDRPRGRRRASFR
jgi:hypothetical protein